MTAQTEHEKRIAEIEKFLKGPLREFQEIVKKELIDQYGNSRIRELEYENWKIRNKIKKIARHAQISSEYVNYIMAYSRPILEKIINPWTGKIAKKMKRIYRKRGKNDRP